MPPPSFPFTFAQKKKKIIMAQVKKQLTELIGHTPLLELERLEKAHNTQARIIAKLEYFNPGGSVKGYKTILTMPETMSIERQNLLKALGAQLVLTPGSKGMSGAIEKANELRDNTPGAVILQQFENPANPRAHVHTTTQEIWEDMDGKVDVFIAGVGTGGTLSGVGEGLKQHNPQIEIIGVEPDSSAVLSGEKPGMHKIQGIGAGFIPKTFNRNVVDRIIRVTDDDAIRTGRELSLKEGLLTGISAGAATYAALQVASQPEYAGKNIVVLLPDTGERYLSTALFAFEEYPL